MIEIIAGLGGAVALLLGVVWWQVRSKAKVEAERDSMEEALGAIERAHEAIEEVMEGEKGDHVETERAIKDRDYFG